MQTVTNIKPSGNRESDSRKDGRIGENGLLAAINRLSLRILAQRESATCFTSYLLSFLPCSVSWQGNCSALHLPSSDRFTWLQGNHTLHVASALYPRDHLQCASLAFLSNCCTIAIHAARSKLTHRLDKSIINTQPTNWRTDQKTGKDPIGSKSSIPWRNPALVANPKPLASPSGDCILSLCSRNTDIWMPADVSARSLPEMGATMPLAGLLGQAMPWLVRDND